ncbi:hypothetical protein N7540_013147 [Penicillium herquei]|nr:hypothetical protein N7540_013147 [Penicillium herquei]
MTLVRLTSTFSDSKVPPSPPNLVKRLILLITFGAGSSLISNGAATDAALFDAEDGGVWAISPGYMVDLCKHWS